MKKINSIRKNRNITHNRPAPTTTPAPTPAPTTTPAPTPAPTTTPAPAPAINNELQLFIDSELRRGVHPEQLKLNIRKDLHVNTIIFKWTQDVGNRDKTIGYFWGLGDILRGMISLYQYCKLHRLKFKIDVSSHPLGKYFDTTNGDMFITTLKNNANFYGVDGGGFTTLSIPTIDMIQVFCNVWPITPLMPDETHAIATQLKIKNEYKIQLDSKYNVFHLRFNDSFIKKVQLTDEMVKCLEFISKHILKPGDILCSNIPYVKQVASQKYGIRTFNEDISGSHIGYETSDSILLSVITDYQIISNAATIYTYSSYAWISGFVQWASILNDKPLIDLKYLMQTPKVDLLQQYATISHI